MSIFGLQLAKSSELCHQISSKTDAVWKNVTEYDAAEPFHVIHSRPISDDTVSNQLLGPHLCLAISLFGLQLAKNLELCPRIFSKTDAVWRNVTEYDAAEPFHVIHMGPISDDAMSNQLLGPHLCLA
jgi:hypothetical protein